MFHNTFSTLRSNISLSPSNSEESHGGITAASFHHKMQLIDHLGEVQVISEKLILLGEQNKMAAWRRARCTLTFIIGTT